MADLLTAGVQAAGSVMNTIGNMIQGKQQRQWEEQEAEKQRQWNEAMQDKSNQFNIDMWNMTNEYNDPANQVARLRNAGLNPMYYGLDGTSANGMQSAQALGYDRASMKGIDNPNAFNALGAGLAGALQGLQVEKDLKAKQAQIDNLNQDTAKKGEETLTEVERRQQIIADTDNIKQQYNNLLASEALTKAQRDSVLKDLEWIDRINEAELGYKESVSKLNDAQRNRIDALLPGEKALQHMSIEDFYHQWDKISAEIAKMASETGLLEKDLENYALNHMSNGFGGTGVSIQNIWRQRAATMQQKAKEQQDKDIARAKRNNAYQLEHGNNPFNVPSFE